VRVALDDPDVPAPTIQWCRDNAPPGVPPLPAEAIVPLGASLWSTQTRASDGTVVNETVRQVGTGQACAYFLGGAAPGSSNPFYFEGNAKDLEFEAAGECLIISNDVPQAGIFLQGCSLGIDPDPAQGLLGGLVTTNTVFNPFGIPGLNTGSFWSLHVYWE